MRLLLNIGLSRADGEIVIPRAVLRDLTAHGFSVISAASHTSDTELTLVVDAVSDRSAELDLENIYALSVALGQDCIAVYSNNEGSLVGPHTSGWSVFNPEFFLRLDGTRLSEPEVTGYVPLSAEDVEVVKAEAVRKHAALWLHNFPQMLEAVILHKNAHLLQLVSPTL